MYPAELDRALAAPADQILDALLRMPEGQWYERKSARISPRELAIPMIAMGNAEGGVIVVGLRDGTAEDLAPHPERVNALTQASADFTRPPVRARQRDIECLDHNGRPIHLLTFEIAPGETVHEAVSGECYLRVGHESRKLGFTQRQELTYDRGQAPFDGTPSGAAMAELRAGLIEDLRQATGATRGVESLMSARSLVRPDGQLTVAAYLLFGEHPTERMPHAHVRVLRYSEIERGSGSRLSLDAAFDHRCEGPIPDVLTEAVEAVERAIPRRRALAASGRFEAIPLVPRDAWLEGLVNAVIHRSYSAAGDHVRVEVFPNRIEIESPGRFPGIVDPTRARSIRRYARNPRVARVCADLNIGRELGEGIHRMFDEMRMAGLGDPIYEQTPQTTRLILPASAAIPADVWARLPRGSERVLAVLRTSPAPMGTGEIVDASGLSRPTVTKALATLQETGFVEWNGKSAKDPRATWSLG